MRIPLFLTWVGLASAGRRSSSSRTVGNHPPTTFERTETIHFSNLVPAAVDYIELVEKRALQQRLGHGTNRQNYQPPQQQQGGGVSQGEESERGGSHGTSPPVSGSRTNHLRPVTDDDEALAVEYGGYTYHGGKGGGKGSKKGGYHNDDYYYSPEEHYDDDNDDYYYDGDDAYAYGKGSKGSKGTKSGKGGSTDKMSKKAKCKNTVSSFQYLATLTNDFQSCFLTISFFVLFVLGSNSVQKEIGEEAKGKRRSC